MNWLDIALVVVLGWFTLSGLMSGLIREIFSLAGFVLGIILAARFHQELMPALSFIENPEIARIVAFAVIFLAVGMMSQFVASLLRRILSIFLLGWANNLGGAAFGFLKGAMIVDVGLMIALQLPTLNFGEVVAGSRMAQLVTGLIPPLLRLLPLGPDLSRWFVP